MLEVKSKDGIVEVHEMNGKEEIVVYDIGAIAHKVMMLIANKGAKTKEEFYLKYEILARKLVDYIETTIKRIDELK